MIESQMPWLWIEHYGFIASFGQYRIALSYAFVALCNNMDNKFKNLGCGAFKCTIVHSWKDKVLIDVDKHYEN